METNILEKLREQIDNADNEILILLKRRFQTSKKIAQYKIKNNMEILQKDRENQIFTEKISKAINMDLDKEFIINLYELILEESKKIQEKVYEKNNL